MDAVVVKIDARTGRLVWATRTGGSDWDAAGDLTITPNGSIYVVGGTRSADFPTTPDAVQRRVGGPDRDVFLLQLDPEGKIVYSTLLGGSKNDEATGLTVTDDGVAYVGGVTMSPDFPGTRVAQFGPRGQQDAFIARVRPGDPHSFETVLLGGKDVDHIASLALDHSGNLFATGYTRSADFPLKNPVQARFGGVVDAFLLKLHIADWSLLFSTYLGGATMDGAYGLALDSAGNPIVSGVTDSTDFPTTPAAFQPRRRGPIDAFVTKLSADGSMSPAVFGLMACPVRRICPRATASSGHTTAETLMDSWRRSRPTGKLCYGSFAGGNGHDILEGLATGNGKVYASGISSSTNLPQKGSPIQRGYGGGPYDAFVIGLDVPGDRSCR